MYMDGEKIDCWLVGNCEECDHLIMGLVNPDSLPEWIICTKCGHNNIISEDEIKDAPVV